MSIELEEGSAKVTLEDVYKMFYIILRQSQDIKPGSKMSFPLEVFDTLPKKLQVTFQQEHGRLFAWIPETKKNRKKAKSRLLLPCNEVIGA